jgi:regulator of protease activity HflC (stomatin/prohibitin superfamily)
MMPLLVGPFVVVTVLVLVWVVLGVISGSIGTVKPGERAATTFLDRRQKRVIDEGFYVLPIPFACKAHPRDITEHGITVEPFTVLFEKNAMVLFAVKLSIYVSDVTTALGKLRDENVNDVAGNIAVSAARQVYGLKPIEARIGSLRDPSLNELKRRCEWELIELVNAGLADIGLTATEFVITENFSDRLSLAMAKEVIDELDARGDIVSARNERNVVELIHEAVAQTFPNASMSERLRLVGMIRLSRAIESPERSNGSVAIQIDHELGPELPRVAADERTA